MGVKPTTHRSWRRAAVALTFLSLGCHKAATPAPELAAVKVATVQRAAGGMGTRYSAHIDPASRVDLAFKVGGYVDTIAKTAGFDGKQRLLQEGDMVREGQALSSVRTGDYVQRLNEARAAHEQAKSQMEQAQRDVERSEKLVATGSTSTAELEGQRSKLRSAQAVVDGAKARADEAATAVADTTLRAPINGTVLKRRIEVGALAGPGTIAFTVADLSSVKAIFAVPDSVLPRLRLGAVQTIVTDAYPGVTFSGRISRISPSADPKSLVFEAEVLIPNVDGRLKAGLVAALSLDASATAPAAEPVNPPLVPLAAVVRAPGKSQAFAVFVVDEEKGHAVAHVREIELGEYLGRVIPVKKGLNGGERIVVLGAGLLSDGESIELIP